MIRDLIYRATTAIVADTIALWSPARAAAYRKGREAYRAYAAASSSGPYQLFSPSNRSGDAEVALSSLKVRGRIRAMERDNPTVAGIVRKNATMVVGDEVGIKPLILGPGGVPLAGLNAEIEARFYEWAETAMADGRSLTECLQLIENHLLIDGEVMARHVAPSGSRGYSLQLLEADYLSESSGVYGVEYDSLGRPAAYFLYKGHPGDTKAIDLNVVRVDASEIHWFAETTRSSQHRGISPLAPAVMKLYGVDDLEQAELIAARSSAAFGLVITSPLAGDMPWNPYGSSDQPTDSNGRKLEYMESGGILRLANGETAQSFKSERPNSNFDSFTRGRRRDAAGTAGMSYESATGDYSQVNYSSARMGRVIEWGNLRRRQQRLVRFLNSVYRKWLTYEVTRPEGLPMLSAAMITAQPRRYFSATFQLAGNDGIDPVKEIQTAIDEVSLGVNSRTDYCAQRGRDFGEVVEKLAAEKAKLISLGLYQEDPLVQKTVAKVEMDQPGQADENQGDQAQEDNTDAEA